MRQKLNFTKQLCFKVPSSESAALWCLLMSPKMLSPSWCMESSFVKSWHICLQREVSSFVSSNEEERAARALRSRSILVACAAGAMAQRRTACFVLGIFVTWRLWSMRGCVKLARQHPEHNDLRPCLSLYPFLNSHYFCTTWQMPVTHGMWRCEW